MALPDNINKTFRTVYDAMNRCWPPRNDSEYFLNVATGFKKIMDENDNDLLLCNMLMSVYNYLDYTRKKEGSR